MSTTSAAHNCYRFGVAAVGVTYEDVRLLLPYGDPHAFEDQEGVDHVLVCAAELLATGKADHHTHNLLLDVHEHVLAPILLR